MTYRKVFTEMLEYLSARYEDILDIVVTEMQKQGQHIDMQKLEESLNKEFKDIERVVEQGTNKAVANAYEDGIAENYQSMYKGMSKAEAEQLLAENVAFFNMGTEDSPRYIQSKNHIERLQRIAERRLTDKGMTLDDARKMVGGKSSTDLKALKLMADTYEDILDATHNTHTGIKKVVRELVRDVAQENAYKGSPSYAEQAKELKERLTKAGLSESIKEDGFVGIVDKAGNKWNVETYSEMVIKTKSNNSYMEGIRTGSQELGLDLAVISDHGAEDDCALWENVVISMNGYSSDYPTYDEAKSTNEVFHPNCEHTVHMIRDTTMLSGWEQEENELKVT